MEIFNIISGICSIVGLALSIFAITKVIKLEISIKSGNSIKNSKIKGSNNQIIGGDSNGK